MQVQPFSQKKQTAVRTGVASAIGVQPSDVTLELQNVFGTQVRPDATRGDCGPDVRCRLMHGCMKVLLQSAMTYQGFQQRMIAEKVLRWVTCMHSTPGRSVLQRFAVYFRVASDA